ncbi:hypothetical protein HC251_25130 (plasmid) [Iamia sp. SCSIO 61187]|uniref:hypothetical protein n=1 Tax=Iamia sp. SCSIO 61187 TaxID=2722752 RepID=UPI001C63444F|nr:hypothetical protein [Iamia sp. SCSIO 61187]QYG95836.1 hypothetical protein HC251_25130 [Iamia sp. SCSIO 61187]
MRQAFRSVEELEKRRSLERLTAAGLVEVAPGGLIARTPAGHQTVRRINTVGQRRGWLRYREWVDELLYPA